MDNDILIAVLMGGPGSERDVSLASGNAVLEALTDEGLNALPVDVDSHGIELPDGVGLCFNTIHGTFGEDGELQKILDSIALRTVQHSSNSASLFARHCFLVVAIRFTALSIA